MDDVEIISRALGGDQSAQKALYEAYHAVAFRLAYLLLQDRCDAEEVVQDSFAYVFLNLRRYEPQRGSFWAWLRVILVSRSRNKRRRKHLPSVSFDVLVAAERTPSDARIESDPEGALEIKGLQHRVWSALQQVSPGARDALVLRYYEDLPYAEIGKLLGCSADAARARVAHGKTQLRALLRTTEDETRHRFTAVVARESGVG
jgi:RNA polymerase sigma-70 factor (ECF subfamily)